MSVSWAHRERILRDDTGPLGWHSRFRPLALPMSTFSAICPAGIANLGDKAFIIDRFDRSDDGSRIHTEDFALVFDVYAKKVRACEFSAHCFGHCSRVGP